jgi:alpha-D-ribose 1-methylphosphonate 5-triphosphate diphosphatase PhnM
MTSPLVSDSTLAFAGITTVVHALLAGWVYRDAGTRGTDATPWVIATLLTGVLGAGGYLLTGRD